MPTLPEALHRLRTELAEALRAESCSPHGPEPKAARVTLELKLVFQSGAWRLVETSDTGLAETQIHCVTVELLADAPPPRPEGHPLANEGPRTEDTLIARLSEAFGAPGFDSSARATVFRESLESFAPEDIRAVIAAVGSSGAVPGAHPGLGQSAHRIARLLERGPAGIEAGRSILAALFERHSPSEILALIQSTWKTQDDWIDRSGPG